VSKPTIAVITTCKGRLHHLKQTLPAMAALRPDELIVVDYSCPQRAGEWVKANVPDARVVYNPGAYGFNLGRARNLGATAANSEWLLFVDADVLVKPGLIETLRAGIQHGTFYSPQPVSGANPQLFGSFCCRARDFLTVRGYDEVIEGWGFEDHDLSGRLRLLGLREAHYSSNLLDTIPHDDSERHVRSDMRDRSENEAINACYTKAKHAISVAKGGNGNPPQEERRNLMIECRRLVGQWYQAGGRDPLEVRFLVNRGKRVGLGTGMGVNLDVAVAVTLTPAPQQQAAPAAKAAGQAAARRRPPEAKPGKARRAAKAPAAATKKKGSSR
jgi:hypothetical protein